MHRGHYQRKKGKIPVPEINWRAMMRCDPEQMHATATRISDLADEFWDDVETLRRDAESLMTAEWTGDASRTHAALWAEWVDSARQVAGALTEDAGLLHQAATEYRRTDDQNVGSISGTRLNMDF
ncbi:WXG100 family type VII secretion target [Rhodococcus sp. ACPA4]|uniref:WXG100 family type VII secretion target n=1 Tax=Rhodococcus sp. ACPA4 TaxID=2028571 RepID=UPI0027B8CEFF|nr:WXG100 family type VII secretion target [Rhodococcus sp. ACPA4]